MGLSAIMAPVSAGACSSLLGVGRLTPGIKAGLSRDADDATFIGRLRHIAMLLRISTLRWAPMQGLVKLHQ
jgi:hypothetical protein